MALLNGGGKKLREGEKRGEGGGGGTDRKDAA